MQHFLFDVILCIIFHQWRKQVPPMVETPEHLKTYTDIFVHLFGNTVIYSTQDNVLIK